MSKTFNLLSVGVPLDSVTTFAELTADADARYVKIDQRIPQEITGKWGLRFVGTDTLQLLVNGEVVQQWTVIVQTGKPYGLLLSLTKP